LPVKGAVNVDEREKRIRELEEIIADLKKRLPAHSVKPAMISRLEELEEELERLKEKR
jgi:hypothetical protein